MSSSIKCRCCENKNHRQKNILKIPILRSVSNINTVTHKSGICAQKSFPTEMHNEIVGISEERHSAWDLAMFISPK